MTKRKKNNFLFYGEDCVFFSKSFLQIVLHFRFSRLNRSSAIEAEDDIMVIFNALLKINEMNEVRIKDWFSNIESKSDIGFYGSVSIFTQMTVI